MAVAGDVEGELEEIWGVVRVGGGGDWGMGREEMRGRETDLRLRAYWAVASRRLRDRGCRFGRLWL